MYVILIQVVTRCFPKRLVQWNLDIVDFEIVEILAIVDKEMLPISNSLVKLFDIVDFFEIVDNLLLPAWQVHYIKVLLYYQSI